MPLDIWYNQSWLNSPIVLVGTNIGSLTDGLMSIPTLFKRCPAHGRVIDGRAESNVWVSAVMREARSDLSQPADATSEFLTATARVLSEERVEVQLQSGAREREGNRNERGTNWFSGTGHQFALLTCNIRSND